MQTSKNIIAIIQSRMTSKRFPGKMLTPFFDKPIFAHVVERIKASKIKMPIILATSKDHTDDPLEMYAKFLGIDVVRGPLEDVMSRFILTLDRFKCDAFFRVCGDSPLLFPSLFDKAATKFTQDDYDLVTNTFPKTFPSGMSVELIKTKIFLKEEKKIRDITNREHITKYFYEKYQEFKIYNIQCKESFSPNLSLALDEPMDLRRLEEWEKKRDKDYEDLFPID